MAHLPAASSATKRETYVVTKSYKPSSSWGTWTGSRPGTWLSAKSSKTATRPSTLRGTWFGVPDGELLSRSRSYHGMCHGRGRARWVEMGQCVARRPHDGRLAGITTYCRLTAQQRSGRQVHDPQSRRATSSAKWQEAKLGQGSRSILRLYLPCARQRRST